VGKFKRLRLVLYGLLAGALLGFGAGCQQSASKNALLAEQMRAQDPNAHLCGLSVFADIAVGLVFAVPGGMVGAAAGAGIRRIWVPGQEPPGPGETPGSPTGTM
jgi:hypothetical protein